MSLDEIDRLLTQATRALNEAATQISRLPLEPSRENVRVIAEVMTRIFDLQRVVYAQAPHLTPAYLNEPAPDPDLSRAFGRALVESEEAMRAGRRDDAIRLLEDFLKSNPPEHFVRMTEAQIAKLQK